jgi:ribosomal protein L24
MSDCRCTPRRTPILERIERLVDKSDPSGCWIWMGKKQGGYGMVVSAGRQGKQLLVHRVLWESVNGPMPEGKESGHRCPAGARKDCVNPAHIEAITHAENTNDRYAGRCKSGRHLMSETGRTYSDGKRACLVCHNEHQRNRQRAMAAAKRAAA